MVNANQADVIRFLASPAAHGGAEVERIDTHTSVVFLAGQLAYKLKRAVRFDYLDFSTAERRHSLCEAEVRLNRRTAPQLYRRVVAVTRQEDGSLALGGPGPPVDWLVEMHRFPQEALFDRLAAAGRLDLALMAPLGVALAAFHTHAESRPDHGGRDGMSWVIEGNAAGFAQEGAWCLDPASASRVTGAARAELARRAGVLDRRRSAGLVRHCHGDLHLRNIVLLDGQPVLFDGVEFNDEIACIDVLYDLAFLLMDLWRRGLPRHANALWNAYTTAMAAAPAVSLLPLFLSCRAAVRAKTSATAATLETDPRRRRTLQDLARQYLAMADDLLRPLSPAVVAIGGFSGSGKSTLAIDIAPFIGAVPGALVLRSDEIRKRLCGVEPLDRLAPAGYSPETSARVYAALAERAALVAREGHSVIVDAVFAREDDRRFIEAAAAVARVPFVGLWLDAPREALIARAEERRNDASDADAATVRMQLQQGAGEISWRRLDASRRAAAVREAALSCLPSETSDVQTSDFRRPQTSAF